jgi:hypothetical protein
MTLRSRYLRVVRASVGMRASPGLVEPFATYIGGPGERPEIARAMVSYRDPKTGVSVSTCAEAVRAGLRDAGVDDHRLRAPFRVSLVFSDILEIALERHALRILKAGEEPNAVEGDVVVVNGDRRDGHMFACDSTPEGAEGGWWLCSIDGGVEVNALGDFAHGQPGAFQGIARRGRVWQAGVHGFVFDHATDFAIVQRQITHVIDLDALESGGPCIDTGDA